MIIEVRTYQPMLTWTHKTESVIQLRMHHLNAFSISWNTECRVSSQYAQIHLVRQVLRWVTQTR